MAARRKSGRFTKKRATRRRKKPKFDILNFAQTAVIGNVITSNAFGLDLWSFITSDEIRTYGGRTGTSANRITLKELMTGWKKHYGVSENEFQLAWKNVQNNWIGLAVGMIGTPIAFKIAKKVLRKPILTPLNKAVRMAGLNDVKVG
jgi:hypothetical protein